MTLFICLLLLLIPAAQVSAGDITFTAIENLSSLPAKERADSLNSLGRQFAQSDTSRALAYLRIALDLAGEINYTAGKSASHYEIGLIHENVQDFDRAETEYRMAIDILGDNNKSAEAGHLYVHYGEALQSKGDKDGAGQAYHRGIRIFTALNDSAGIAFAYNRHGLMKIRVTQYDSALVYYPVAYEYYKALGNEPRVAAMLNSIGACHYQLGRYELALKYYLDSVEIRRRIGDMAGVARVTNNIGKTYLDRDKFDEAYEYFTQSLEIAKEIEHRGLIGYSLFNLGEIEEYRSNLSSALEYYEESLIYRRKQKDITGIVQSSNSIGAINSKTGRHDLSIEILKEGYDLANNGHYKEGMIVALKNMGEAYVRVKDYSQALDNYNKSLALSLETGNRIWTREIYLDLSDLYALQESYKKTHEYYKLYSALKDSMFSEETEKNIDRMKIAYNSDLKEQENEVLRDRQRDQEALLRRNNLVNILISLLFATAVIFSVTLFKMYRGKMRANLRLRATNSKITSQRDEIEKKNCELEEAVHRIKTLAGLLPICANCKKIRDDDGYWQEVEAYIGRHSDAMFSHGICPDCITKLYPEYCEKKDGNQ